jgi:hypothetical protein
MKYYFAKFAYMQYFLEKRLTLLLLKGTKISTVLITFKHNSTQKAETETFPSN